MGIIPLQLWLTMVLSLLIVRAITSPTANFTDLNSNSSAANGFPFNTKFEPLVNAGVRNLKQFYPGADLFLVHSSPAALPWAYLETEFTNFDIEGREFQQHKLVVQLSRLDRVGEWSRPFEEDWPFGTRLRTWSLREWRTPLKDVLKILEDECEVPGPWLELQVMKYRSDRRPLPVKDELQLALRRATTEEFAWYMYGMESGLVHKIDSNLSTAAPVVRNGAYLHYASGDVQTS